MKKIIWNYHNILDIPDEKVGIYYFWAGKTSIYIGMSRSSIQTRLLQHYADCHNEKLKQWLLSSYEIKFSCEFVSNRDAILAKERLRIKKFTPIANIMLNN